MPRDAATATVALANFGADTKNGMRVARAPRAGFLAPKSRFPRSGLQGNEPAAAAACFMRAASSRRDQTMTWAGQPDEAQMKPAVAVLGMGRDRVGDSRVAGELERLCTAGSS